MQNKKEKKEGTGRQERSEVSGWKQSQTVVSLGWITALWKGFEQCYT